MPPAPSESESPQANFKLNRFVGPHRDGTACDPGPVRVGDCRSLSRYPGASAGRSSRRRLQTTRLQPAVLGVRVAMLFGCSPRPGPSERRRGAFHPTCSSRCRPGPGLGSHRHGHEARRPRAGPPCFRRPPRFFPRLLSRCCRSGPIDPGAEGTRALGGLGFQQTGCGVRSFGHYARPSHPCKEVCA